MARFPRPADTINTAADLKVGDRIWEVCGIWPPHVGFEMEVVRAPQPLRQHPDYLGNGDSQADLTVFDIRYAEPPCVTVMWFATDGNMVDGHSHNDNYWFRSKESAEEAKEYLTKEWLKNPDLIEQETERRRLLRHLEDHDAALDEY